MTMRGGVWRRCFASVVLVFAFRAVTSLASFPIFKDTYHWDRLDQGNIFSAEGWGVLVSCLLAALVIRHYGSKYPIILAHVWHSYFAFYCAFLTTSFYEIWANRFFSAMAEGMILIGVFHTLIYWLPVSELLSHFFFLCGAVGVGYIVGSVIAWTCYSYYGWPSIFIFMGILSLCVAYLWRSKGITSYPKENQSITPSEQNYIQSTHYKFNRKELQRYWTAMLLNCETLRFGMSAFSYGYVLYGLLSFHGVLFLEATTLQSELQDFPLSALVGWCGWILASVMIGAGLYFNVSVPYFHNLQFFYGSHDAWLVEGIFVVLSIVTLSGVPNHPDLFWLNIRFFPLYFYLSAAFTCFIISHIHCENSEPELLLGVSFMLMSLGGVISQVLGGLILEMSGSYNIVFRYQSNILIFSAVFCCFIPWIYRYRKRRKRTIYAQRIDTEL